MDENKRVVILQKALPHYRAPFFELLRKRLADHSVTLVLVYGDGSAADRQKGDLVDIEWAVPLANITLRIGRLELCLQPAGEHIKGCDLVIVEQANKLLINYWLLLLRAAGLLKLAFWGHGLDFTAPPGWPLMRAFRRFIALRADWWFAYTGRSRDILAGWGYRETQITVVDNSIDTRKLMKLRETIGREKISGARRRLGLTGENICVFSGGMYAEKRLSFLFEAAALIRRDIPDFELVLLGAGPDAGIVQQAASRNAWIHWPGPLFDEDKAVVFALSKLCLMPGLVGLVILDAFSFGVPLVTTDIPTHSPEIEYLKNGVNGLMTPHDVRAYANVVTDLLRNAPRREELRAGALSSAGHFSAEGMADRFCAGILSALQANSGR